MFMKPCALNRCEPCIEVIMQMVVQCGGGGGGGLWVGFMGWGCQGGCERERKN